MCFNTPNSTGDGELLKRNWFRIFLKNLKNRFIFDQITCICSQATADCKPFRAPPNTLKRFTDSPCCALLEKPAKYYFCFVFGAIVVIFRQLLKNTCILLSFFLLIQRERGDAYCLTTHQVCNTARSCVFSMTCYFHWLVVKERRRKKRGKKTSIIWKNWQRRGAMETGDRRWNQNAVRCTLVRWKVVYQYINQGGCQIWWSTNERIDVL